MSKIRIGFNVNGVLRNFIDAFVNNYDIRYGDDTEPVHEFINLEEVDSEYQTKEYATENVIKELIHGIEKTKQDNELEKLHPEGIPEDLEREPIDFDTMYRDAVSGSSGKYKVNMIERFVAEPPNPYDLLSSFGFASPLELSKFLFEDFVIELFGSCDEVYKGVVFNFNQVEVKLKDRGYEPVLITKEVGRARAATLFFLSSKACEPSYIRFLERDAEYWEHIDVLVTDNPNLLNTVPEGKKTIKLNTLFNKDVKSNLSIDSLQDLNSDIDEIINKL